MHEYVSTEIVLVRVHACACVCMRGVCVCVCVGGNRHGPFDVVWVSDCLNPIYGLDSYEKLATSVRHLAGPQTYAVRWTN